MLRRKPSNASEKEQVQEKVQKKKLTLQRSSSFKDFMKPKSPVVVDKELNLDYTVPEDMPVEDAVKSGSKQGKKSWRNVISRTMTRKTSKTVQKALAEEGGESGDEGSLSPTTDWMPGLTAGNRTSVCSNGSEDTVHSPVSRQLSGCGDRQSLDSGYSQRDSMRLEESSPPYTGPFCGRARVHTDFIPSPYDIESLKLQKGDIIQIIEKDPVGTWTGKLNNKVGTFKFIYVNILPDEATPPMRKMCPSKNRFSKAKNKPQTLEEVLERIGLTELGSLLSMHGFQSLEDFGGLKESHLNELNITDAEQRTKILTATELLRDSDDESEPEEEGSSTEEKGDVPRDSGCFESTENMENGRHEPEGEPGMQQKSNQEPEQQQREENQLSSVEEQLQELTVDEEIS
ncbi:SAM and SH3 domain-containing protein 3 [Salmo salar]|uniref:SAM and SH3 domain-containing protein 3 n=1 Tax=Salmo salar TaxID=8030 RepID=B5X2Y3_SALSA|nr:SAM and SH3 domain-containing protein 3 [Salmo salar]ACI33664.1 SH3 protein expressed in lymphocytes [Salmo salar]|eukprot:XP_014067297.1 PREDICTED: SAM and SH3 domain-containing protein 3 [Salmo salar]